MKLNCEGCQAKYTIADEKVAGRNFKIRCKRCGAALVVRGEGIVAAAPRTDADWYVLAGDRQDGPFDVARLREMLASGAIDRDTYVWKDGLPDWRALGEVSELATLVEPAAEPDLFDSSNDPSPFAPSAEPAAPSLTGTRNESSVLFSLSNLSALSTSATEAPVPIAKSASAPHGAAKGDGSGLIDIRALAAATQPAKTTSAPTTDELLSLGSAPSLASPLGPPVLVPVAPERSSRSALVAVIGAAGAIVLAAAAVVVAVVFVDRQPAAHADAPPTARIEPPAVVPPPPEPARVEAAQPTPAPIETRVAAPPEPEPRPREAREIVRAPRRAVARVEEEPVEPARPTRERTIEEMIDRTLEPEAAPRERERAAQSLPQTPSRADVVGAMGRVAGPVRACGDGARGMVPVRVVFSGDTGRVASAQVNGTSVAPEVRSCIARAVRDASVPRFAQSTFSVVYPFAL